jgi:hypothetical protein
LYITPAQLAFFTQNPGSDFNPEKSLRSEFFGENERKTPMIAIPVSEIIITDWAQSVMRETFVWF